jgi:predicted alpha/beta-hydrolase family hydrolase
MPDETIAIALPNGTTVSAALTRPAKKARWIVAYAPGAGSNVYDPFGRCLARTLAEHGMSTLRIQFPYMEAKKGRPDPPAVLEATWRAAIETARKEKAHMIAGGRSMGGRIASMVVAAGEAVDGLALFAYPLHPPGQPEKLRDAHLPSIAVPALFCSGTRDAFASPDELRAAAKKVKRSTVHLLDGADHGFSIPKASGRTKEDVWTEATQALLDWLASLTPGSR